MAKNIKQLETEIRIEHIIIGIIASFIIAYKKFFSNMKGLYTFIIYNNLGVGQKEGVA